MNPFNLRGITVIIGLMNGFDRPLFKRLAHNDTGSAAGHQGGIVITKDLDRYFPQLSGVVTIFAPTVDTRVKAALFVGSVQVGLVETRYQYQTWGAARSPERRLTGNLGLIRNLASADDFLLIERSLSDPESYRLTLHKAGTPEFAALLAKVGVRRWGPVNPADQPVAETEIIEAVEQQTQRELDPLALFDSGAAFVESRTKRVARSQAFKRRLLPLYDFSCAACGQGYAGEEGNWEAEAAHIVPRGLKGADDSRNGLALCRSHHWAFDQGLFGILPTRRIVLRPAAAAEPRNAHLKPLAGLPIRSAAEPALVPSLNALDWHLKNVVRL